MPDFKQNAGFNTQWCKTQKTVLTTQNNEKQTQFTTKNFFLQLHLIENAFYTRNR